MADGHICTHNHVNLYVVKAIGEKIQLVAVQHEDWGESWLEKIPTITKPWKFDFQRIKWSATSHNLCPTVGHKYLHERVSWSYNWPYSAQLPTSILTSCPNDNYIESDTDSNQDPEMSNLIMAGTPFGFQALLDALCHQEHSG